MRSAVLLVALSLGLMACQPLGGCVVSCHVGGDLTVYEGDQADKPAAQAE